MFVLAQSTVIKTCFRGYPALKEQIMQGLQDAIGAAIYCQVMPSRVEDSMP